MIDVTKAAADQLKEHFKKERIDPDNTYVRLYMAAG